MIIEKLFSYRLAPLSCINLHGLRLRQLLLKLRWLGCARNRSITLERLALSMHWLHHTAMLLFFSTYSRWWYICCRFDNLLRILLHLWLLVRKWDERRSPGLLWMILIVWKLGDARIINGFLDWRESTLGDWTIKWRHESFEHMSNLITNFYVEVFACLCVNSSYFQNFIRHKVIVAEVVDHFLVQSNAVHHQILEESFFEVDLRAVLNQLGP